MTSTIKTSNDKLVTKIKNFLKRQKSFCVTTCTNGIYAITIFDTGIILSGRTSDQTLPSYQAAGA